MHFKIYNFLNIWDKQYLTKQIVRWLCCLS